MSKDLIRLPFHPSLKGVTTLTGFCITPAVFRFIEESFADFAARKITNKTLIQAAVNNYYLGGMPDVITAGNQAIEDRRAIHDMLAIGEFMIGSCRVYQSQRGLPYRTAVGVVNERYRATSAIALLPGATVQQLADFEQLLHTIRTTNFLKNQKPEFSFGNLISEMMSLYVMPLARQMAKQRMRAVKSADRQQWVLS